MKPTARSLGSVADDSSEEFDEFSAEFNNQCGSYNSNHGNDDCFQGSQPVDKYRRKYIQLIHYNFIRLRRDG